MSVLQKSTSRWDSMRSEAGRRVALERITTKSEAERDRNVGIQRIQADEKVVVCVWMWRERGRETASKSEEGAASRAQTAP